MESTITPPCTHSKLMQICFPSPVKTWSPAICSDTCCSTALMGRLRNCLNSRVNHLSAVPLTPAIKKSICMLLGFCGMVCRWVLTPSPWHRPSRWMAPLGWRSIRTNPPPGLWPGTRLIFRAMRASISWVDYSPAVPPSALVSLRIWRGGPLLISPIWWMSMLWTWIQRTP